MARLRRGPVAAVRVAIRLVVEKEAAVAAEVAAAVVRAARAAVGSARQRSDADSTTATSTTSAATNEHRGEVVVAAEIGVSTGGGRHASCQAGRHKGDGRSDAAAVKATTARSSGEPVANLIARRAGCQAQGRAGGAAWLKEEEQLKDERVREAKEARRSCSERPNLRRENVYRTTGKSRGPLFVPKIPLDTREERAADRLGQERPQHQVIKEVSSPTKVISSRSSPHGKKRMRREGSVCT